MDWLNLFIFALLILGHTTLWVTFVNRTHALPLKCQTLRQLRHVHDFMIVLFPFVLIWGVGLTGPRLLLDGEWKDLHLFWRFSFGVMGLGAIWLGHVVLRALTAPQTSALRSNHSMYYDIAAELGRKPIAHGPYEFVARFPLNEQFQLEANTKTLQHPHLPKEWEGLSILHLSDWHFQGTVEQSYFRRVCEVAGEFEVDLVCFTGDLLDRQQLVAWLPDTLGQLRARLGCYFILGNHDWYQRPDEIRRVFAEMGWVDVASRTTELTLAGRTLEIGGDETPWMGHAPEFSSTAEFRLLLSHTPDNIKRARRDQVDLMLSGHNHGGQVRLPIIGPVYSPSLHGCKYASGTFWEAPTLMHVSRGLSGNHPFRWHCLPEVTEIVLHPSETTSQSRPPHFTVVNSNLSTD